MPQTRRASFPIVSASGNGPPYERIFIVVHGLLDLVDKDNVEYDVKFRHWLKSMPKSVGPVRAATYVTRIFRFSLRAIVRGKYGFEQVCQKLFDKVEKLQSWPSQGGGGIQDRSGSNSNPGKGSGPDTPLMPSTSIVFLCHGVGTWLVKEMLSQDCGGFIAVNTLSIIPLDTLHNNQDPGQKYATSLMGHLQMFGVDGFDESNCISLSKLLERADTRFAKLQEYLQEVPRFQNSREWMAESVSVWTSPLRMELPKTNPVKSLLTARSTRLWGPNANLPNGRVLEESLEGILGKKRDMILPAVFLPEAVDDSSPLHPSPVLDGRSTERLESHPPVGGHPEDDRVTDIPGGDHHSRSSLAGPATHAITARPSSAGARSSSPPDTVSPGFLKDIKEQMRFQAVKLLKGSYKESDEATENLQRLKSDYSNLSNNSAMAEVLSEIARLIAHSLTIRGDYWKAAEVLVEAPSMRPDNLKHGMTTVVRSSSTLRDLALVFCYLGFFTRAESLITLLWKSLDRKLKEIERWEDHRGRKHENQTPDNMRPVLVPIGRGHDILEDERQEALKVDLMTKRDCVALTAGIIFRRAGDYHRALRVCEEACLGLSARLGAEHVKTLEAQILRADLLALTSDTKEAENTCYRAWKILTAKLGPNHPQTLNGLNTLVSIFRVQHRSIEALDTARALCRITVEAWTGSNPQRIWGRAELARALKLEGDYKAADIEYEAILRESRRLYSPFNPEHPEVLLYESEKAEVLMCLKKLTEAEDLVLKVLRKMHHAYQYERTRERRQSLFQVDVTLEKPPQNPITYPSNQEFLNDLMNDLVFEFALDDALGYFKFGQHTHGHVEPLLRASDRDMPGKSDTAPCLPAKMAYTKQVFMSYLRKSIPISVQHSRLDSPQIQDALATIENEISSGSVANDLIVKHRLRTLLSKLRIHPCLLQTLQVLVCIWLENGSPKHRQSLVCEVAEMVLQWRTRIFGKTHDSTLSTLYTLAMARRSTGDVDQAREILFEVHLQRALHFEKSHPATLQALRELIITSVTAERWDDRVSVLEPGKVPSENSSSSAQIPREDSPNISPSDLMSVERKSMLIAITLGGRVGKNHPETIHAYLWVMAVQILLGKVIETSETSQLITSRLFLPEVLDQRFMQALQMAEKVAILCMDYRLVGDALDMMKRIVNSGSDILVKLGGYSDDSTSDLRALSSLVARCREKSDAMLTTEAGRTVMEVDAMYNAYLVDESGAGDADIYIMNGLKFASAVRGFSTDQPESIIVRNLRAAAFRRFKVLMEFVDRQTAGDADVKDWEQLKQALENAFRLLNSAVLDDPEALEKSKRMHLDMRRVLAAEEDRSRTPPGSPRRTYFGGQIKEQPGRDRTPSVAGSCGGEKGGQTDTEAGSVKKSDDVTSDSLRATAASQSLQDGIKRCLEFSQTVQDCEGGAV